MRITLSCLPVSPFPAVMLTLVGDPDQETYVPITPHQQLTSAMKMPSAIRMHHNRGRYHLHIEHGGEQGDRDIRESFARSHRDQLDREAVATCLIGINL